MPAFQPLPLNEIYENLDDQYRKQFAPIFLSKLKNEEAATLISAHVYLEIERIELEYTLSSFWNKRRLYHPSKNPELKKLKAFIGITANNNFNASDIEYARMWVNDTYELLKLALKRFAIEEIEKQKEREATSDRVSKKIVAHREKHNQLLKEVEAEQKKLDAENKKYAADRQVYVANAMREKLINNKQTQTLSQELQKKNVEAKQKLTSEVIRTRSSKIGNMSLFDEINQNQTFKKYKNEEDYPTSDSLKLSH